MGMGLIALYDAEQEGALSWRDAALDELRQLADAYPGKLTLREWLVWGLAAIEPPQPFLLHHPRLPKSRNQLSERKRSMIEKRQV